MGMYRVTVNDNETYLVVMKNIFSPRLLVHKKYDLKVRKPSFQDFIWYYHISHWPVKETEWDRKWHKSTDFQGSTVQREASDKEKSKELPTLKDNDFVNDNMVLYIGDESKEELLSTLQADVDVSIGEQCSPILWFESRLTLSSAMTKVRYNAVTYRRKSYSNKHVKWSDILISVIYYCARQLKRAPI